jgi:Tol biopolymer transport system component
MTMEPSMNPLTHTLARRYVQAAADNWLEPAKQKDLQAHLAACAECRRYAEQTGLLEKNLRILFHRQWDAASERGINLLPAVRTGYRRRIVRNQVLSLVNTMVTVGLVVGLVLLLNWFLSTRRNDLPAGSLTPTPTLSTSVPPSPTVTQTPARPPQAVEGLPALDIPLGSITFVSSHEELGDMYMIQTDGSGETRLFEDALNLSLSPAWSPDGSQLAFVSTRDGNSEVYILHAGGSQPERLTDDPATDTDPAWSPDGKTIAFTSDRSGYQEIYRMDAGGTNLTRLTNTLASNEHPTWSPDGAFIAFGSNRDGYWQIYRMNADGTDLVNLSNDPMADDREPAWSPDGLWIAFTSQPVKSRVEDIYRMHADGSGRTRLTGSASPADEASNDFSPAWSPDSQWIVFCSYRDNQVYGDLYLIPVDGTAITPEAIFRLTTQGGSQPAWKP